MLRAGEVTSPESIHTVLSAGQPSSASSIARAALRVTRFSDIAVSMRCPQKRVPIGSLCAAFISDSQAPSSVIDPVHRSSMIVSTCIAMTLFLLFATRTGLGAVFTVLLGRPQQNRRYGKEDRKRLAIGDVIAGSF